MAGELTSSVLSFVGWAFLPRYVTSFLQSLYYRITIRAGSPHPSPNSPRYVRHYRRIYIFVVTSYLLYTIFDTFYRIGQSGDFYQLLGVLPSSDERTIKTRFRRLAALHHPDKLRQTGDGDSDGLFVQLRLAQDTLLDPVKRFAYDRFGKTVVEGSKAKTSREFLYAGLYTLLPQYFVGLIVMILFNLLWFSRWGRYWRFYVFFALFTLELSLLTHPNGVFMPAAHLPGWLTSILHLESFYLLPFQTLTVARSISISANIFISQLAPPGSSESSAGNQGLKPQTQRQLIQLTNLARANDMEATKLLQLGMAPFRGDKESVATLRKGMKEGIVLGSVRESSEVQEAVKSVQERRQAR